MIHASDNNEFVILASHPNGPGSNAPGATITPAQNAYGSYATVMATGANTDDAYGILININSNDVSASARPAILTIGLDSAGGTTFTDTINHLICCDAAGYEAGGGVWYYFPIWIKAGTTIGAKASVDNATVGTMKCQIWLMTKPSRPGLIRVGAFVETFGANTATSSGTSFTPGVNTKGSYASLGTLTRQLWHWDMGISTTSAAVALRGYMMDLAVGDATNKKNVIVDMLMHSDTSERISKPANYMSGGGANGDNVYIRAALTGSVNVGMTACAYGVGG